MSVSPALDGLLTVAQVAQRYHLQDSTIRTYIKKGLLPAQKTPGGKNWLIREQDALAHLSAPSPTENSSVSGPSDPHRSPRIPNPNSPLIDRLGTPEGRAHAVAVLQHLGEDWDADEQRISWEQLRPVLENSRVQMRRWNLETGERRDDDT